MDKKKVGIIIGISVLVIVGISLALIFRAKPEKLDEKAKLLPDGKILVVYFSATNNTKQVAMQIAKNLKADLFEVEPTEKYTSTDLNWNDQNSRVSIEHNNPEARNVSLKSSSVNNWDSYKIILIGYPIWWGEAAWPINTFIKNNDFTGKTILPFCTSASSLIGESDKILKEMAGKGNWLEGYRFSSSASEDEIKSWTDTLR